MKKSSGVILTDGENVVICLPTGKTESDNSWDIPKGEFGAKETYEQAMIRECYEETGLCIDDDCLNLLGKYPYLKDKDLYLSWVYYKKLPTTESMVCNSYFSKDETYIPEISQYKIIPLSDCEKYLMPGLCKLFKDYNIVEIIKKNIKENY